MFEELPKNTWVPSSRMALFGAISGGFVLGLGGERVLLGVRPWDFLTIVDIVVDCRFYLLVCCCGLPGAAQRQAESLIQDGVRRVQGSVGITSPCI